MMKKKRRHGGHYCKVCSYYKSNESLSGRGHVLYICREHQLLPKDEQADMMRCNEVERVMFRFPMRRQGWKLLEKYVKEYKGRESGEFAQEILDMGRGVFMPEEDDEEANKRNNDISQVAEALFSELEEDTRTAIEELLEDNINEYMIHKGYIPEGKDLQDIVDWVLKETNDILYLKAAPDSTYRRLVDDTVRKMVKEQKDDDLEIETHTKSLTIVETKRLVIRKITRKGTGTLLALMGKSEVMYTWEHGFNKKEVHQWINRQFSCYRRDGYEYFAFVLKDGGKLIGQAGPMKSVISGNEVVELGHILDDTYWYDGYATEAARKCPRYAFEKLGLQKVYCGIRPENTSSTRVAEATVIKPCDSYTVIYDGKEMPYLLYKTEKLMQ